ncbi:hypothetical protein HZS38_04745 [Xenorhabdus nematophila]|uniref:Uncharacterized protein n=1 Tax=Xenorhabdus nematophila (strain ATCC 19061 / DSM 3370 / CCUG 14189 / LMG 1036 / NCIMB 9965 / AN6) TaxID=406817 RepID=D3VCF1_XENNA|nr:hypothetical protein [Xenorhabdus nematophila]MBA0018508.1 hypothetical protein [Xenorhabdus nematophila]CBJ89804.1 hypothetical protein XNC1_1744 [Xenorhabdus nematophila ATCC 19061]CEF31005.1 hypothetical protein XNW1_3020011 [Xenorhabdus nematophila str. Websteri]CEK22689.1 hypothetical protein XNC2_1695 [Xenorhabdus nematophila AN6/1]
MKKGVLEFIDSFGEEKGKTGIIIPKDFYGFNDEGKSSSSVISIRRLSKE